MTKTRKISAIFVSALALSAVTFVGGTFSSAGTPAYASQSNASCTKNYGWASNVFVGGKTKPVTIYIPSTNGSSAGRNCLLGSGNNSTAVKTLQIAANKYSAVKPKLTEDGIFGANTKAGVKQVQTTIGAKPVDGVYGIKTHNAMHWPTTPYYGYIVVDNIKLS